MVAGSSSCRRFAAQAGARRSTVGLRELVNEVESLKELRACRRFPGEDRKTLKISHRSVQDREADGHVPRRCAYVEAMAASWRDRPPANRDQ